MTRKHSNKLFFTNYQKALKFLATHPAQEFMEREVQEATGMSKAGVNQSLRALALDGLVEVEKKGRLALYRVDLNNPLIRQIKVLANIMEIGPLVNSIKKVSEKIVLYGSASSGTDSEDSDIDLFVLSDRPEDIQKASIKSIHGRHVHIVVRKPLDYMASKQKDKIFYGEVSRGIIIYDRQS